MRRWGFSVAAMIVTVMSLALPVLHLHEVDTYVPLGFQTQVWVRDAQASASVQGLGEAVERFAQQNRVNVARQQTATDNADFGRELYVAVGAPNQGAATWLREGYPEFSRLAQTDVRPWRDLDFEQIDPRGFYLVEGPPDVGTKLAQEFSRRGFTAVAAPFLGPTQHLTGVLGENASAAAIAALAAVVLVGATVLLNAKTYGVGRLHGRSFGWLLRRDVVVAAPGVLSIVLALSLAATVALALYNRLHWIGTYWLLVAALLLASGAAAFITHTVAIWLTSRVDVIEAVKGHLPTWSTLVAAYLLRVPAALLAVVAVSSAVALAEPAQRAGQNLTAARDHAGDAAFILLNGSLGEAGTEDLLFGDAARWFERADLDGRIVLADDSSATYWDIPSRGADATSNEPAPDVLTVNPTYLLEQVVLAEDGARLTPEDLPLGRPTVLVPAARSHLAEAVTAQAVEDLEFARSRSDAGAFPDAARMTIASGQELFTYGGVVSGSPGAVVRDAFLVVVPPQLRVWGPAYIHMAESIVLREPGLPADVRADRRLATAILATLPVQQKLADVAREAQTRWTTGVVTSVVAAAVLLAVVFTAVAVYVRAWASRLFVRFVHGWSRLAANPVLVAAEATVLAVVLLSGARPWLAEQLATPPDPSVPPPPNHDAVNPDVQLAVTAAVLLLSVLVAAVVLRSRERNIIADRAIDRM